MSYMNNILPKPQESYKKPAKKGMEIKYQYISNDKKSINELYTTLFGRLLKRL